MLSSSSAEQTNFMDLSSSRESDSCWTIQEFLKHFMETEGSLPCSQTPFTDLHSELDESSPYHPILILQDPP
jgi:hypothetical protein